MSLLDDVSIVVTPNGYKAETLYGVLPTATEGSELVTNGNVESALPTFNGESFSNYQSANTQSSLQSHLGTNSMKVTGTGTLFNTRIIPNNSSYLNKRFKVSLWVYNPSTLTGDIAIRTRINAVAKLIGTLSVKNTWTNFTYYMTSTNTSSDRFIEVEALTGTNTQFFFIDDISVKEWTASDMDVTRATAGTRVDENGLVNYAQVVGSEVVINGDFDTDSNWAKGANTTISGGKLNSNSAGVYVIASQVPSPYIFQNKVYKYSVTYTITSGSVRLGDSNQVWAGSTQSTSGTYTNIVTSSSVANGQIYFTSPSSDFVGSIDNVSVKETDLNNVPRIDYTGGGCPHILSEPQRTNLVTYSEDFGQWNKIGITVTSNSLISPDGTQNAGKLVATSGASNKIIYQSISANTYTASVFAKKGEFEGLLIATGTTGAFFNLNTNTYRTHYTSPPTSYKIENYGNGWYRYSITFTQSSSDNLYIGINDNVSTTFAITGNGTNGIYTFGAQLEAGTYPTSYIPTSGSTVTRNQDVFTRDGIASLINSTEGVLFGEIAALSNTSTDRVMLSLSDGTTSNRVYIRYGNASNQIEARSTVGGANSGLTSYVVTDETDFIKVAYKWKLNDYALWINGVEVATVSSGAVNSANTLNKLSFDSGSGTRIAEGKIKQLQVYKTALSDSELETLTTI